MGGTLSVGVGSEKDQPQSEKAMGEEPKGIAASSGNRFEGFERDRGFLKNLSAIRQSGAFAARGQHPAKRECQRANDNKQSLHATFLETTNNGETLGNKLHAYRPIRYLRSSKC
jgi:hypothetical protein